MNENKWVFSRTKETLASGNLLSVINVLMQLRKVCNHPNLFEVRPTISPFQMEGISTHIPSLVYHALDYDPLKVISYSPKLLKAHIYLFYQDINLAAVNLLRINFEFTTTAYIAHRIKKYITPKKLIEDIDSQPELPPPVPKGKIKLNVRANPCAQPRPVTTTSTPQVIPGTSPVIKHLTAVRTAVGSQVVLKLKGNANSPSFPMQLVQNPDGGLKGTPSLLICVAFSETQ
jgi:E1A-binding protein p400